MQASCTVLHSPLNGQEKPETVSLVHEEGVRAPHAAGQKHHSCSWRQHVLCPLQVAEEALSLPLEAY